MRLSIAAAFGITAAVALAGCGTTVAGDGRLAAGQSTGSQTTSGEPTPTGLTSSPPDGGGGLDCPEPSVSPPGAPYCYTQPAGLEEVDLGAPTAGEAGGFRTSFGFGPPDHVDVQAYPVGVDTDSFSDDEIIAELASVILDLESGGFDFVEQPTELTVDDARAFGYDGRSTAGSQDITAYFVFRGTNEIQVNCARTDQAEVIDTACADVLDSLQLVG